MKIVFFGDSYTQGTPYPTDSKNIWPNIVAEHFDADVENKYVAGGSNHAIMRNICRYFQQSSCDVAIVMWSDWSRTEVHVNEQVYQLQPNGNSFDVEFIDDYYRNRNINVDWEDFLDKIWLCDKINSFNTRIIQGCCFDLQSDFEKPANWFPYSMHKLALKKTPCGHPHISQHKDIARTMIQHIEGCNIL